MRFTLGANALDAFDTPVLHCEDRLEVEHGAEEFLSAADPSAGRDWDDGRMWILHCPGTVAKQDAGRAVLPVENPREGLRADDERPLLAVGHGADTTMYFQWRKSLGAAEKMHGAVVDHGEAERTRVFQDIAAHGMPALKASYTDAGASASVFPYDPV